MQVLEFKKKDKLEVVNGLRGIAILAVMFHHLPVHAWVETRWSFVGNTGAGVNLFFILSGVVLYRPFLIHQQERMTWVETGAFFKKRFLRLYPLFFLNCFVCAIFFYKGSQEALFSALKALTTISLFYGGDLFPMVNWVLWSLMVEVWFSLLFPLLLLLIRRFSINATTVGVLLFSLVCRYACKEHWDFFGNSLFLFSRLDDFVIGIWLCHKIYTSPFFEKESAWLLILTGCISLGLACVLESGLVGDLFKNNFFQLGFVLLTYSTIKYSTWLSSLLSTRFLQQFGMMCFSLYVWHGIMIDPLIKKEFHATDYVYYFLFVAMISIFTYRFVEFRKEESWKKLFQM